MTQDKKPNIFYLFGIIFLIFLTALIIQNHLLLNIDVSWLMHAADRMFAGGNYTKDFFDPDPPLILYLNIPPIILSKIFSINFILALRIYIFLLASFSLYISYLFIQKIFSMQDYLFSNLFLISLALILFVLPLGDFGQREHLLLIFVLPYLFMLTCRLQEKAVKSYYTIAIGLLAGVGFAIKPFYLITPLFIEVYYCLRKKNTLAWIRSETLTILGFLIIYAGVILLFHYDYLSIIVPYALRLHYNSLSLPWKMFALNPIVIFLIFLPFLFFTIQYSKNPYRVLCELLLVVLVSFLLSYLIQRTIWYNHLLPVIAIAILILTLLFTLLISQSKLSKLEYILATLLGTLIVVFIYYYQIPIWISQFFHPFLFNIFFVSLFAILLYAAQSKKNILYVFAGVFLIISISYLSAILVQSTELYSYTTLSSILMMLLLFCLLVSQTSKTKITSIYAALIGILIFSFPVYYINSIYQIYKINAEREQILFSFTRANAQYKKIYFFGTQLYAFPNVDYTNSISASRFPFFWMLPSLIKQSYLSLNNPSEQQTKDKDFLINMITEDFAKNKPDLVFVEISHYKNHLTIYSNTRKLQYKSHPIKFDFLIYFLQNEKFKSEWKNYQYFKTLVVREESQKFQVYQRIVGNR